ncbi:hybrid sensor histidine kinase/response regulator transcription factor [Mucilaginibacter pineti]|uniref:hybrid sensor histidine kinase/response regulator transcription factor n=1 Tax=Mucilaginibacter pineti TaxID=1391627 RepID=UPI0013BE98F3|nr:hybrid sensor histidine kinase/response regulator transcription factor [Mucilaginibacter pineti]
MKKIHFLRIIIFLSLSIAVSGNSAFCQSYPYKFKYLTVDVGLSHTDANDLVQDKLGYIWIATNFGLDRFDGYTIKKFYNTNIPLNNAKKNRVICLYPDDEGNIWLGTEGGLQRFDSKTEKYIDYTVEGEPAFWRLIRKGDLLYGITGNQLRCYSITGGNVNEQKLTIPSGVNFSEMARDSLGNIYLATNKGVWLPGSGGQLTNLRIDSCPDLNLSKIFIDNKQNILIASGRQLFLTNKITTGSYTVVRQFTLNDNAYVAHIAQDSKLNYWINTGSGLMRLNSSLQLTDLITNKNSPNSLNSSSLNNMYIDRSQCLWVCTFGGGVNYCDLNEKRFYTLQHDKEDPNSMSGSYVRSVLDENGQNLWIGTNYDGLNRYDLKLQKFTFYNTHNSAVKLKDDNVTALTLDNEHNLWIGHSRGIEILKANRKELWNPPGSDKFPNHVIDVLTKDCFGNIWFGNHTDRFGVIFKDDKGVFNIKYYGESYFIFADKKKPELFVSSTHGLKRILIDKDGNILKTYDYQASEKKNSLSSNYTYPVSKQNDSTYWIGTIGGGVNRLIIRKDDTYSIKAYTGNMGIFNDVESLEIDNAGNIWMGGNGLQFLNPVTGKLIRYEKNDGLQGNSFKVGASFKGADGRLYFGGINGLNYFYPNEIKSNQIPAHPVLTDLLINNQKPIYGKSDSAENTLDKIISYSKALKLNYLQNNFVISFSAMHYANPLKCKYRYKLIGYDKTWKYTDGTNPGAAYSNLDYDNYQFIVEATNNDGLWSSNQATIAITVTPPWWKSTLAKIIYFALVIGFLLWIYIYQARWYRLKRELAIRAVNENKREEMHKQREELHQQQLQFFTNISHEFRTPLTLILGPLENIINGNKNDELTNPYQLMLRNVKRLINLINELMNFRKIVDSAIKLQVQPLAIGQFCNGLYLEFKNLAASKNISFKITDHTTTNGDDELSNLFDAQVLEKILFNLINNAIKYTNNGGQVTLEIFLNRNEFKPAFATEYHLLNDQYRANAYIYFLIADTGIGISTDSISNIFDRYYRISKDHLGSGVGLALVKSLTQLHKGDISVYSERNKGTQILVALPWGKENYTNAEIITPNSDTKGSQLEPLDASILAMEVDKEQRGQLPEKITKHILLVEDNHELRTFLRQSLEKFYYIHEAEDGNAAIELAADKTPDLIISDVMMPGMNGIELCKLIKDKFETSHIPFIILSAKDALDAKIAGMESGADYYFAKPLSIDLLLLTIQNIFDQGQKLKLKYTNDYLTEATELVHNEKDKDFINKLLELIEANIQDADLDVDFLCNNLYISRTKLYQKIKSISDQSVGEFIKTIRLKKAIQIMTHEDVSLSEVADRIGLQSHSYFSRVFKKEFGKSPSQYMQSLKNGTLK